MKAEIEDTYAEAFDGILARVIVTADHQKFYGKPQKTPQPRQP